MEYIDNNGTKVIVEGNMVQYGDGPLKKRIIGVNYKNGMVYGGYLSSFNGLFNDELIGVASGLSDIVNTKIGDVKDAYDLLNLKINNVDKTEIFELSRIVLETVNEYFGGFANIDARMSYYYSEDYDEREDNKISNLKGTGAAVCVERSALAQNLLRYLGINSFFKTSGIMKNGSSEVHSYNLVEYNNKFYIFDTSLPNLINGKVNPLISEIDKDTFDLLSAPISDIGISVTVSHYNPYRDVDLTITYDSGRKKQVEVSSLGENNNRQL